MPDPYLLITGFGPFEDVAHNASGELARALHGRPGLVGLELPTAYEGSAQAIDGWLQRAEHPPAAILALGVHRGAFFRLESRCASRPPSDRLDVTGAAWGLGPRQPGETAFDLEACREVCAAVSEVPVRRSDDAGGYVCDATYEHVLRRGRERGFEALFLHVPPMGLVPVAQQVPVVLALTDELWRQLQAAQSAGDALP